MNELYRVGIWVEVIADNEDDANEYVRSVIAEEASAPYSLINDYEVDRTAEKVT